MNRNKTGFRKILPNVLKKIPVAGQGLLEFALVIPIFMLLVFGIFEFGRYLTAIITINTSSREAARYGAGVGKNSNGIPFYQDCTGITEAATEFGLFASIDTIDIRFDHGPEDTTSWESMPTCSPGLNVNLADRIRVRVEGEYRPIILFSNLVIPLESTSSRTIVTKLDIRSTEYPVENPEEPPEDEEEPEINPCDAMSVSAVTPVAGQTDTYSFVITNGNTDVHAAISKLYITHGKANGTTKYFSYLGFSDVTIGGSPVLMYEIYLTGDKNALDNESFTFLPYNAGIHYPSPDGPYLGIPPQSRTEVKFKFTGGLSWNTMLIEFNNFNCSFSRP